MTTYDQQCPNGHAVAPGDQFCETCGAPLVLAGVGTSAPGAPTPTAPGEVLPAPTGPPMCPNGHPLPPGSAFCPSCGAMVAAPSSLPTAPPPPPPGYAPYPAGYGPVAMSPLAAAGPTKTNGLAIASLVCSLSCFIPFVYFLYLFAGPAAIVLGILALRQIRERGDKGRGLAIAGITVASVILALAILAIIVIIIVASTSSNSSSAILGALDTVGG